MDEPIFDPVTYALLKSQLNTDNIQNDSEYITGEDLTAALDSLNSAIDDTKTDIDRLFYSTGTYTVSYPLCVGWVTGGGKSIELYIFLPKRLDKVNIINITALYNCYIRAVDGTYIGGSASNLFDYIQNTQVQATRNSIIAVTLVNTVDWGPTNNTPLVGNLVITFELT